MSAKHFKYRDSSYERMERVNVMKLKLNQDSLVIVQKVQYLYMQIVNDIMEISVYWYSNDGLLLIFILF